MAVTTDELWKVSFRVLMPQYIEFFFPEHYHKIDWQKDIVFLDKELQTIQPNSRPKNRIADVLVMLHRKRGKPLYVLLHIEVQGYFDKLFGYRMHQMRYRIEDRLGINPVMLCIFTDDNPHFHPKEYCVETWGAGARTYFNTYKVMENHPDNYKNPNSVVSLIMETVYHSTHIKNKSDDEIMGLFIPIVRKLFTKGFSKEEIKVTIDFIQAHVKFGNSENYINFEQKIEKMVKYKSTDELVAAYFDTDTQILNLQKKVKRVEKKLQKIEKAEEQAEQQLKQVEQQAKQAEQQAKQAEQQAKQAEQQAKQAEQQAKEMREEKERSILLLLSQGVQVELIAKALVVNAAEIISIQEKYKDNNPILDILKEQ